MGSWFSTIKNKLGKTSAATLPGMEEALELVLANSYPKIRLVHGYKQKLQPALEFAWQHITRLIETLPDPLDATSDEMLFVQLVNPFFIDSAHLKKTLRNDPDLSQFLSQNPPDLFYVLLTMDRKAKTIFGAQLKGEIVVKDVALKTIGFSDHKFRVPSTKIEDATLALRKGVLQILAHWALEKILEEKSREEELRDLRAEMTTKLKILETERQAMVLEWRSETAKQSYGAAQKMLEEIEKELSAIKSKSLKADYYLEEVECVLAGAKELLTAEMVDMHLDHKNILLEGPADETHHTIRALDIKLGQTLCRSCVLLKCSRQVLLNCI
ncbi:MAG: hypothetical protein M0036_03175 [Desulfobacteraceae bacterium]|nr:hypothetical protein [Desulfobacteraceae bacterium]